MKLNKFGIFAKDVLAETAFYRDIMGMKVLSESPEHSELQAEGGILMFSSREFVRDELKLPLAKSPKSARELAFDLSSFEEVNAKFDDLSKICEVILPLTDYPWGQRTFFVSDPEGNLIEVSSFGK